MTEIKDDEAVEHYVIEAELMERMFEALVTGRTNAVNVFDMHLLSCGEGEMLERNKQIAGDLMRAVESVDSVIYDLIHDYGIGE